MKKLKHCFDSNLMLFTALCMEVAPSPPLRASPGPSIAAYKAKIMRIDYTYE